MTFGRLGKPHRLIFRLRDSENSLLRYSPANPFFRFSAYCSFMHALENFSSKSGRSRPRIFIKTSKTISQFCTFVCKAANLQLDWYLDLILNHPIPLPSMSSLPLPFLLPLLLPTPPSYRDSSLLNLP
jgi:hypothetical protein